MEPSGYPILDGLDFLNNKPFSRLRFQICESNSAVGCFPNNRIENHTIAQSCSENKRGIT